MRVIFVTRRVTRRVEPGPHSALLRVPQNASEQFSMDYQYRTFGTRSAFHHGEREKQKRC